MAAIPSFRNRANCVVGGAAAHRVHPRASGRGGPVITFSHGWPLSADAWDAQMLFLGQRGYRVIAHDRRGHGRSGQTWHGNNMDQYADDLAELMKHLDLKDATMVGTPQAVARLSGTSRGTDRSVSPKLF